MAYDSHKIAMRMIRFMKGFRKAALAAFPHTIPVLVCYLFMGIAAGLMLSVKGYHFGWSTLMAASVLSGTMQFMGVELLAANASLFYTGIITLMVNFRYLFYGISMLDKFKASGPLRPYMIFGLTDETYSLLYATQPPEGVSRRWYMFCIAFFDHMYWVAGCTIGATAGSFAFFDTTGIDFVMTALFVTIFLDQWKIKQGRIPSIIGLGATALCLVLFSREQFILVALAIILAALTLLRSKLEMKDEENEMEGGASHG